MREASRNEFMENGGIPDRVKSFREIERREDRPRARPEIGEKESVLPSVREERIGGRTH